MTALVRITRWELRKLGAQRRTYLGLVAAAVTPAVMIGTFSFQDKLPLDYPFGRLLRLNGYSTSLVLIGFAAIWLVPLLVCLVAGDIFASEDANATWKLILTRSVGRSVVFWSKVLAAAIFGVAVLSTLAVSSVVLGGLRFGFGGTFDLSGRPVSGAHALALTVLSWALSLPTVVAFVAVGLLLSVLTRNSAAGVVTPVILALAMSLAGSLGGIGATRHYLLTTQFEAFHGLWHQPAYTAQLWRAIWLPAVYVVALLAIALIAFLGRDVTEA